MKNPKSKIIQNKIKQINWNLQWHLQKVAIRPLIADRNGFGNVSFCGRGKTGVPGEKTSEKGREPTTNSAHT